MMGASESAVRRRLRKETAEALEGLARADREAYEAVMHVVLALASKPDKSRP